MADLLTIDIDKTELVRAMTRLGASAQASVNAAAHVSAENIAREARARVRRRTGKTAEGIRVAMSPDGDGWRVTSHRDAMPNVPIWLEFGTSHARAYPYFFNAARLEEGPHLRRIEDALQAAIDREGLG